MTNILAITSPIAPPLHTRLACGLLDSHHGNVLSLANTIYAEIKHLNVDTYHVIKNGSLSALAKTYAERCKELAVAQGDNERQAATIEGYQQAIEHLKTGVELDQTRIAQRDKTISQLRESAKAMVSANCNMRHKVADLLGADSCDMRRLSNEGVAQILAEFIDSRRADVAALENLLESRAKAAIEANREIEDLKKTIADNASREVRHRENFHTLAAKFYPHQTGAIATWEAVNRAVNTMLDENGKHRQAVLDMADALDVAPGVNMIAVVNHHHDQLASMLDVGKLNTWNQLIDYAGSDHGDAVNYGRLAKIVGSNPILATERLSTAMNNVANALGCPGASLADVEKVAARSNKAANELQCFTAMLSSYTGIPNRESIGNAVKYAFMRKGPKANVVERVTEILLGSVLNHEEGDALTSLVKSRVRGSDERSAEAGPAIAEAVNADIAEIARDRAFTEQAISIAIDILNSRITSAESNISKLDARTSNLTNAFNANFK